MKRRVIAAMAALVGLAVMTPAGAEPQQGATSAGAITLQVTQVGDSETWGPWQFAGEWRTDDGASFTGLADSPGVTTSTPTPPVVIPDFYVSGSNATGALQARCDGTVTRSLGNLLEVSVYCVDYVAGAALAGEDSQTLVLAAVQRQATGAGDVTIYRGTWGPAVVS